MQTHLKHLGLENFRVFKNRTDFDFAPITILTGTNSSGKSSLISAMEMLHENIKVTIDSTSDSVDFFSPYKEDSAPTQSLGIYTLSNQIKIGSFKEKYSDLSSCLSKGGGNKFIFSTKIRGYKTSELFKCNYIYLLDNGTNPQLHLQKIEIINQLDEEVFSYSDTVKINLLYFFLLFQRTFNLSKEHWRDIEHKIESYNNDISLTEEDRKKILADLNSEHALNQDNRFEYMLNDTGSKIELTNVLNFPGMDNWSSSLFDSSEDHEKLSKYNISDFHNRKNWEEKGKIEPLIQHFTDQILGGNNWNNFSEAYFRFLSSIEHRPQYQLLQQYQGLFINAPAQKMTIEIEPLKFKATQKILKDLPPISGWEIMSDNGQAVSLPKSNLEEWFYNDFLTTNLTLVNRALKDLKLINVRDVTPPPKKAFLSQYGNDWLSKFANTYFNSDETLKNEVCNYINRWINNFQLGKELIIRRIEGANGYQAYLVNNSGERFNLTEVGYGITMILRVIIHAFNESPKDESWDGLYGGICAPRISIIEEPESNLHPALQSKLADMFVDAARTFNTQFIIETHSEYLIRKLQYLTAKQQVKPEDTAIYYFYPADDVPPGEDQVKKINIRKDGSLTGEFGSGFFDEADNIALELFLLKKSQEN